MRVQEAGSHNQKLAESAKQGAEIEAIAFHQKPSPESGERKPLNNFRSGDWWLNVDYLEESEAVDEQEMLRMVLQARKAKQANK